MPTNKPVTVEQLTNDMKASSGIYLADFSRVTVQTVTALRNTMRTKGIRMRVAKNTLIKRALSNNGISGLDAHLVGPTAVIMADDQDPIAPAKLLVEFHKTNDGFMSLKVLQIDGQAYQGNQLVTVAKTPGKRELQSQIISLALGPGGNLLALLKGPGSKLASQIQDLVETLEKGETPKVAA